MSDEYKINIGLTLEKEMLFRCDFGKIKIPNFFIDERHLKVEEKIGPDPSRLLGLAILGCLEASFEFCLQKKKFKLEDFKGVAEVIIKRNEKGFWRVKRINIELNPKIDTPEMRKRADQCKKMFEQYCIISQSVREGIEINVNLDY